MKKRNNPNFKNIPQPSEACNNNNQQVKKSKRTIWGVDVANGFIILNDGNPCTFYLFIDAPNKNPKLPRLKLKACKGKSQTIRINDLSEIIKPDDFVILEQTGNYGIRYAQLFTQLGAKVFLADSKLFAFFRKGRNIHKNDKVDAYLLRQMFFDVEFRYFVYKYIPEKHHLRQLVKSLQKAEKERTRIINRTKNLLAITLPKANFHHLSTEQFIKKADEIKTAVASLPHPYTQTILINLEILKNYENLIKQQTAEIESIIKNHPDFELLNSIKGFGTKTIATLIAYYWDIKRFKTPTQFKGYLLKGTIREQSGTSVDKSKNLRSRPEVKKVLYLLWKNTARRKNNPLRHLVRLSYDINKKKAWLKFADKLLELIFYMLKHRLTFQEALDYSLKNKKRELKNLIKKLSEPLTAENKENFFKHLVKAKHLLKNIVAYENTATELKGGATELCHEEKVLKETYTLIYVNENPELLKTFFNNLNQLIGAESLTEVFKAGLKAPLELLGGLGYEKV